MNASLCMEGIFPNEDDRPSSTSRSSDDAIDIALMQQVANGDERSFRQLILRHQNAVIGTVARMLNDPNEAEDIAQQVFVRVWQSAKTWRPDAKFTTYLFTITRNLVFNESRRRSRKREVAIDDTTTHPAQLPTDERPQPDATLEKRELYRKIDAAIAALPEQQRLCIVLRTFQSLDYEDIAATLGCSVASVKSLLFRARATLRDLLHDELHPSE